jgi:hypothetical protein
VSGASWKRPGSGAMIASPFDVDSPEPEDEGRENWYARRGRKKLAEGRMPPACVVLFELGTCWNVVIVGEDDAGRGGMSLSPPMGKLWLGRTVRLVEED